MKSKQKLTITHSLQWRLVAGYSCLIAALLVLLNTYPLLMSQNLMFRSQHTALSNQALLVANTLTTADVLTAETVEQAISQLEDLSVYRLVVTDQAGLILYDSSGESLQGKYALTGEIVSALQGKDAFFCTYQDGVFYSRAATPVMTRNQVVGAVCLYDEDSDQGALLSELQGNLRLASLVVCLAVFALFGIFSAFLSRRVRILLSGIRTVREGEYNHRIHMNGRDEMAQLAEEFNELTRRIQRTEEERRRFVSDASHELKTPLASIRLMTDSILQDETMDRETLHEFVGDIGEATDRLIAISRALLELNKLDESPEVQQEPVDLNWQLQHVCHLLAPLAERAGVELIKEMGQECVVRCNPNDANQILQNLMENAIKYNQPGGRVIITTASRGSTVELTVADTGVGIPQEEMQRIFERFYRVDKARSRAAGGTGLGLSIVQDAVRRHGGQIAVAERPGGGALFTVTLSAWKEGEA